ncbi:uncharacterized protein BO97DRAFT_356149 [Aspergillus homomorphus CBS 101889]|uniref:Uncharacterized protein n=1 Tax=Aspergillus homomorphus (strain CBS 101889) TaxID=1450537 RepID=A0A395HI42_ASPHC|nr:hypothetical protein BO97DRAFT_356149 [Aspergillus homomorphus CBS 101889]RAL07571.1 hypothetical protein BO97DRAFT_356149 [Aspergillus homomorphus CBS 101889]
MAEPEDVEEDLFADLYDADDTAAQTTSLVELSRASDPIASAPSVHTTEHQPLYTEQSHVETEAGGTYQYSHQPGRHQGVEIGGAGFANHSATPAGDSEPQGTGIKEDG